MHSTSKFTDAQVRVPQTLYGSSCPSTMSTMSTMSSVGISGSSVQKSVAHPGASATSGLLMQAQARTRKWQPSWPPREAGTGTLNARWWTNTGFLEGFTRGRFAPTWSCGTAARMPKLTIRCGASLTFFLSSVQLLGYACRFFIVRSLLDCFVITLF